MSDSINPDHYKRLPAEAIEIIEAAIGGAPSNQDAYLHGQVLKYILRCWNKNGIEDLKKAKWYLDRLVEHCDLRESLLDISNGFVKAWACENGKAKQVCPEQLQPPDGWRFLEVGEVIRKGDKYRDMKSQTWIEVVAAIGDSLQDFHKPTIRRNRFEVGEKVVDFCGQVWEVEYIFDTGNRYRLKHKEVRDETYGNSLAPYIEDAK